MGTRKTARNSTDPHPSPPLCVAERWTPFQHKVNADTEREFGGKMVIFPSPAGRHGLDAAHWRVSGDEINDPSPETPDSIPQSSVPPQSPQHRQRPRQCQSRSSIEVAARWHTSLLVRYSGAEPQRRYRGRSFSC
jgi:hypothetical protein